MRHTIHTFTKQRTPMETADLRREMALAEREQRELRRQRLANLRDLLAREKDLGSLVRYREMLLDLNDATGGALVVGGKVHRIGNAPAERHIMELNDWLGDPLPDGSMKTMQLPKLYTPAEAYAEKASGLLAVDLQENSGHRIMWFKPQLHPGWPMVEGHVPRMSMTYHPKQLDLTSAPWSADELSVAWKLQQDIREAISSPRV